MPQFSETTGNTGLIQLCEQELFGDTGFTKISGDNDRLKMFTNYFNEGNSRYTEIAIQADGNWIFDDSNQTDLPISTTNLVANQQDYAFNASFIDILGIEVADSSGNFYGLKEVTERDFSNRGISLTDTYKTAGQPREYMKLANSVFLLPAPSYAYSAGLKARIQRPHSYFVYTDTIKTPGFNSNHHQYLVYYACWRYAKSRLMPSAIQFEKDVIRYEGPEGQANLGEIGRFYSSRNKDKTKILRARKYVKR